MHYSIRSGEEADKTVSLPAVNVFESNDRTTHFYMVYCQATQEITGEITRLVGWLQSDAADLAAFASGRSEKSRATLNTNLYTTRQWNLPDLLALPLSIKWPQWHDALAGVSQGYRSSNVTQPRPHESDKPSAERARLWRCVFGDRERLEEEAKTTKSIFFRSFYWLCVYLAETSDLIPSTNQCTPAAAWTQEI